MYVYCQNADLDLNLDGFAPLMQHGEQVTHIDNVGRESHAYLEHIIRHYHDLPMHVIFSQSMVHMDREMIARIEVTSSQTLKPQHKTSPGVRLSKDVQKWLSQPHIKISLKTRLLLTFPFAFRWGKLLTGASV